MKEQLISFETAKLAKEKGFFIGYRLYNETGKIWARHFIGDQERKLYSASTQSLLQKWIRETHRIHIEIAVVGVTCKNGIAFKSFGWQLYYMDTLKMYQKKEISVVEKTYEEALEKALFESLKLIKSKNEN